MMQRRIKKYLNRDSFVAHAPINVSDFYFKEYRNFWLSVNRLTHHKRVDIQVRAFQQLPNEKLIIVGSYEQSRHFKEYANYIKRIKPNNVEILSWVEQDKLKELYATCKGVITTSRDEDYGLSPLEGGASGKPTIASNEGGHKEIIIQGKTGILIDNINEDKLVQAIKEINKNPEKYKSACLAQAQNFDTKIFIDKKTWKGNERKSF